MQANESKQENAVVVAVGVAVAVVVAVGVAVAVVVAVVVAVARMTASELHEHLYDTYGRCMNKNCTSMAGQPEVRTEHLQAAHLVQTRPRIWLPEWTILVCAYDHNLMDGRPPRIAGISQYSIRLAFMEQWPELIETIWREPYKRLDSMPGYRLMGREKARRLFGTG